MALKHLPQGERLLSGTLSALLSDVATTMTVSNPPASSKLPTYIEIDPDSDDDRETVRAVSVSGSVVTIERGVYSGGVGVAHLINTPYKQKITSKHWDFVVDALENGYLTEDASLTFTRNSTSQFRINSVDQSSYYTAGRRVRINGSVVVTVVSSTYSGGNTVITVLETTVPTPITAVELAVARIGYANDPALDVLLTESPASDTTATGLKTTFTAGESVVFGNVCYYKSDGKMWKADASAIATASVVGIALATISADASGSFLLLGIARDDSWNWTVGGLLYLSETAGAITQTAPTTTDSVTQILGVATHADRIYFNPQLVQVEHT